MTHAWKYGPNPSDWEHLSDTQLAVDCQLVKVFESLELNSANGTAQDADVVGVFILDVDTLPPFRKDHWKSELLRIGVKVPKAKPLEDNTTTKPLPKGSNKSGG